MAIFNCMCCVVQRHPNAIFYPPFRTLSLWLSTFIRTWVSGKQFFSGRSNSFLKGTLSLWLSTFIRAWGSGKLFFFRTIKQFSEHILYLIWGVVQDVFGNPNVRAERKSRIVEEGSGGARKGVALRNSIRIGDALCRARMSKPE